MAPEIGQVGFRIAFFLIVTAGALLFFTLPGTAEFYVTVLTLLLGLGFAGFIFVLLRILK